jgi:hypothetical protein
MTAKVAALIILVLSLCFGSGCGLIVELTTTPAVVDPGGDVDFAIKLTNPSRCPAAFISANLQPFVPAEEIVVEGDDELVDIIQALIFGACTGGELTFPDGVTCRLEGLTIVCEAEDAFSTPGDSGTATVSSPAGVLLNCERQGSRFTCTRGPASAGTTAASTFSQATLACGPGMGTSIECGLTSLAGGEMATANFTLPAPGMQGIYFNILFASANVGLVCADGTNAGSPCLSAMDCPGGTMNNCVSGVCVDDTSGAAGVGCNPEMPACPSGDTCISCSEGIGEFATFPFACSQTQVLLSHKAPTLAPWGWAAMLVAVFGVEVVRRRRRI